MAAGFVIAIVGAESTGKSALAVALAAALRAEGRASSVVGEYLREFCERNGRTPRQHEQAAIAAEQTRRIAEARRVDDVVVADTSALMIAVYSDHVFGDRTLYPSALAQHAAAGLTLLTALDLPWQADGLQRDGPHAQAPVDALVRTALRSAGIDFSVVIGSGDARLQGALRAVRHALRDREPSQVVPAGWQWHCERCGEAGACPPLS